jgi:hypothetical protein
LDSHLNLNKFLWKKRLILIKNNTKNLNCIKEKLNNYKKILIKNKIEYFYCDHSFSKNVVLIGLDGLVKFQSQTLNLKKILKLISQMPMANF